MTYGVDTSYVGCCGVREIHSFASDDDDDDDSDVNYSEIKSETFPDLLAYIKQETRGMVLHIHFKKPKTFDGNWEDSFEWEELRQLIAQIPGVMEIPEHINPNSGNKIVGYVWLNQ